MMRGELRAVWSETFTNIWDVLFSEEGVPQDIFCELYRALSGALRVQPTIAQLADVIDDPKQSEAKFRSVSSNELAGEVTVIKFFEEAYEIIDDLAGSELASEYSRLLASFVEKFSLRYQLQSPCLLCPTLSGIFSALLRELRDSSESNPHVIAMLDDFDEALRGLRGEISDGRIKTIIQKQVNVLEAVGSSSRDVSSSQLGGICGEIKTWPHNAVRGSLSNLYGFASDYPGIRHAGNPLGALRAIDMRDLIAISVSLAGFTPYLRDEFDPASVYWGADSAGD